MCLGCYKEFDGGYCGPCRQKLFDGRKVSAVLPFETPKDENLKDYQSKTRKLSISGVQLKYSLRLEKNELVLTEANGEYILKPIPPTIQIQRNDQAPENEHLTMQLAAQVFGIDTAANALIYFKDGTPAYITRRFDLKADGSKYQQEDMAQLSGRTKKSHGDDFKYEGTYEEVGQLISKYAAAALPSLENFFRVIVFNYIFSNGDAHLKNFSLIQTDMGDYALSKAYDLMSTAIHTPDEGQTALDLYDGYTENEFFAIYGVYGQHAFRELASKLGIPPKRTERILSQMLSSKDQVQDRIGRSLLSDEVKAIYLRNYQTRIEFLGLTQTMITAIITAAKGKNAIEDKEVELVLPRALRIRGKFLKILGDNKYLFETTNNLEQIEIDGDQLHEVILCEA